VVPRADFLEAFAPDEGMPAQIQNGPQAANRDYLSKEGAHMSQRSKEMVACVLGIISIAGVVVYFQYHPFHWWLLIGPVIGTPLVVIASRRQKRWDDLRSQREQSLIDAGAAEQAAPKGTTPEIQRDH
jgi:hypothetical protein